MSCVPVFLATPSPQHMVWHPACSPVGWIEAWSIRTFDLRMQRGMYTMASWWVVILLYNMLKSMNICPYPKTIALMNKYTLFLYVFHPLFLAILGCYVFAYTNGINIFLEVICLYLFSLAGCFIIFLVVFIALPLLVRFIKGKGKLSAHSVQALCRCPAHSSHLANWVG